MLTFFGELLLRSSGVRFKTSVITDAFEVFSHARFPLLDCARLLLSPRPRLSTF